MTIGVTGSGTGLGQSGTFVYHPDIKVWIATDNDGVLDISGDLISANVTRSTNTVSTFSCEIQNTWKKYDRRIQRMNRIVVWLQRTQWLQVFSGYVTLAPFETVVPGAIQIQANCTLKRLENTYWDVNTPEAQSIMPGSFSLINNQSQFQDGGAAQGMLNILSSVVGWNPAQIHFQSIPQQFFQWATSMFIAEAGDLPSSLINQLMQATDAQGTTAGNNQGGTATSIAPPAGAPAKGATWRGGGAGTATWYYNYPVNHTGPSASQPSFGGSITQNVAKCFQDAYGCAMGWTFGDPNTGKVLPGMAPAISYLQGPHGDGKRLLVTNTQNGRAIIVRTTDWEQAGGSNGKLIDLSDVAWQQLAGTAPLSQGALQVTVQWADDSSKPGPVSSTLPTQGQTGYGAAIVPVNQQTGTAVTQASTNPSLYKYEQTVDAIVQAARSQIGVPYSWGGGNTTGPTFGTAQGANTKGFDCSGLVEWAYGTAQISMPKPSQNQWEITKQFTLPPGTLPNPGDLIFYEGLPPQHVAIASGPTTLIQAPQTGELVQEVPIYSGMTAITRPVPGSGGVALSGAQGNLNLNAANANDPLTVTGSNGKQQYNTANLFNTIFTLPQIDPRAIMFYGSARAFITDEPVLNSIAQLCTASLRSFQSAPNGDFVAWFPDFFGIYGKTPALQLRDIEIVDFKIQVSDAPLATHVAVVGDTASISTFGPTMADWLSTEGIVSLQETSIMNILFGGSDKTLNFNPGAFLAKFGMRPYVVTKPTIKSNLLEFLCGIMTFMEKWADQYSTTVTTTFLPEVYPGMLIQLPDQGNLQVYVQQVQHNISRSSGFTTQMTITAPTRNGAILEISTPEPWFNVGVQNPTPAH